MKGQTRGCLLAAHEGRHSSRRIGICPRQSRPPPSGEGQQGTHWAAGISAGGPPEYPPVRQEARLVELKLRTLRANRGEEDGAAALDDDLAEPARCYLRRAHHSVGVCTEGPVDVGEPPRRRSPR